jgi:hypothetical protein
MIATLAALFGIVVLLVVLNVRRAEARHPEPRASADDIRLIAGEHYNNSHVASTYRKASRIKKIVDGLFCYCFCKGGGHYSLLDCFRDDHGAGCDICLGEVNLAYEMSQRGATLEEIRAEVDKQFSGSH